MAGTSDQQDGVWWLSQLTDNGVGFTTEAAQKAPSPFYTTRTVGLGLGLRVTHKIVEVHQGRFAMATPAAGKPGTVRISLPLSLASSPNN